MNDNYRTFFGLNKEPFGTDIRLSEILKTPELIDVKDRFDYVIRLGAIGLVTGEVGSGKSTALRYKLYPSEYRSLYITASSGSIMEFYRQFVDALDIHLSSNSKAIMVRMIKKEITDLIREKKMKIVLIVDEASLMRLEVFAELHTICQFEKDSKPWLPVILAGQNSLIDTFKGSSLLLTLNNFKQGSNVDLTPFWFYTRERKFSNTNIFLLRKNTGLSAIDIAFKLSYPETNQGSLQDGTSQIQFGVSIPISSHKYSIVEANSESIFPSFKEKGFSIRL